MSEETNNPNTIFTPIKWSNTRGVKYWVEKFTAEHNEKTEDAEFEVLNIPYYRVDTIKIELPKKQITEDAEWETVSPLQEYIDEGFRKNGELPPLEDIDHEIIPPKQLPEKIGL